MDPIIQDFAAKYIKVDFIKIDVDQLMVLSNFYFISLTLIILYMFLSVRATHHIYILDDNDYFNII
jgi:hypothetical protein